MQFQFENTTFSQSYSLSTAEKSSGNINIPEEAVVPVIKTAILAISDYARAVKNKEKPIAVIIDDLKGNMLLAAIVRYHEGEGDMPGNWSYEWSFDPEDIKDCIKFPVSESKSHTFFIERAKSINMEYSELSYIYIGCDQFANTLINWLDTNAKEEEEVELELSGYFKASVIVDGGKKIMSFVPDGAIKRLIKDDAVLETL
jgi:hypothetical protein